MKIDLNLKPYVSRDTTYYLYNVKALLSLLKPILSPLEIVCSTKTYVGIITDKQIHFADSHKFWHSYGNNRLFHSVYWQGLNCLSCDINIPNTQYNHMYYKINLVENMEFMFITFHTEIATNYNGKPNDRHPMILFNCETGKYCLLRGYEDLTYVTYAMRKRDEFTIVKPLINLDTVCDKDIKTLEDLVLYD